MSQRKINRFWKNISLCYQFTYISITSYPDAIIPIMYQRIPNHLFWLFATPHLVYVLFRHHLAECKHFWHSTMWGQRQLCVSFVHVSLSFATACFQEDELFEPLYQCMDDTDATGCPLTSQQWQPQAYIPLYISILTKVVELYHSSLTTSSCLYQFRRT